MDKTFFGLFHLFVKCSGVYSDEELLQLLGIPIKTFTGTTDYDGILGENIVYISENKDWVHISDECALLLWHISQVKLGLEKLATKHDVFYCAIHDYCSTFPDPYTFAYYKNGKKLREVVYDPKPEKRIYFGKPLKIEETLTIVGDIVHFSVDRSCNWLRDRLYRLFGRTRILHEPQLINLGIAKSIGIDCNHENCIFRGYEIDTLAVNEEEHW